MADENTKKADLAVEEAQDGSATVELTEDLQKIVGNDDYSEAEQENTASEDTQDADADAHDDDEELRQAKRNRRKAKKELVRKTNQEKDLRLQQLQRENEQFKQRLSQLERNTKAEQLVRIDKGIEDAQVRLEYAKMKLAEATRNNDGDAMVEAQTLWQQAQDEVRQLSGARQQADRELKQPVQNQQLPDPGVQRLAAQWMRKNNWYNPQANDPDSRIAKKMDELMAAEGRDPSDPEYWEELDNRLQKALPHRYNDFDEQDSVNRKPRNVVGSSGREASAAYGGSNRSQFLLSPDRVRAMKEAGAWDNPERKAKMIKSFMEYDRANGRRN